MPHSGGQKPGNQAKRLGCSACAQPLPKVCVEVSSCELRGEALVGSMPEV